MMDTTQAHINIDLMEQRSSKGDKAKVVSKTGGSLKRFRLLGELKVYAYIWYTIIKAMSEKDFYQIGESITNDKKYANLIDTLIKNLYNSNKTPKNQKEVIQKDKKLKFLILQMLKELGIFTSTPNKVDFNKGRIETFQKEIAMQGAKLWEQLQLIIHKIMTT